MVVTQVAPHAKVSDTFVGTRNCVTTFPMSLLIKLRKYVILYDMKTRWILAGADQRPERLTYHGANRRRISVSPVLTVGDLCRRLRKSRRQIYRYMQAGRLQPSARILGQWLFSGSTPAQFRRMKIPSTFRRFFWDVRLSTLSVERHRDFILSRLLEHGNWASLRWVLDTYPRTTLITFLNGPGARRLSERAWAFWNVQLRHSARAAGRASWGRRGRRWGGGLP